MYVHSISGAGALTWSDPIEAPLPDELVAVDSQAEGVNLRDGRRRERVGDVCCFVGFDDAA